MKENLASIMMITVERGFIDKVFLTPIPFTCAIYRLEESSGFVSSLSFFLFFCLSTGYRNNFRA